MTFCRLVIFGLAILATSAPPLAAQHQHHLHERHVGPNGARLDFTENGVWRAKARDVRQTRERLRAERRYDRLNAPARTYGGPVGAMGAPQASWSGTEAAAVTGVIRPPTVLLAFADTELDALQPAAEYDRLLYGTTLYNAERPYTLRTFYEEMSGGLFSVQGEVLGWVVAEHPQAYYTAACWTTNDQGDTLRYNAIDCTDGLYAFGELMVGALRQLEAQGVDFTRFDGTGDGQIDVLQFIQPLIGGECGDQGMWAHKWNLTWANRGEEVLLADGAVRATNYTIQSGLGGHSSCDPDDIMPIGTLAHELGHGIGLPDLYDITYRSTGVGTWDLMAAGNYATPFSPAHLGAWSKEQLGWVTVREIAHSEIVDLGPVLTEREVLLVRPTGDNPRGEYFLLENRQALGADWKMVANGPRPGMLVWHVDSQHIGENYATNRVNVGEWPAIHGVAIIQADGYNQLRIRGTMEMPRNHGDTGDPFPGSIVFDVHSSERRTQHELDAHTHPAWVLNQDSLPVGFGLYDIQETGRHRGVGNRITFDLRQDGDVAPSFARADRPEVRVKVDGASYTLWSGRIREGKHIMLEVDSLTVGADGLHAWPFVSWSNGGGRIQTVYGPIKGDTLVATTGLTYRLKVDLEGEGTILGRPDSTEVGMFINPGQTVTLIAQPSDGHYFHRWTGQGTFAGDTARVVMSDARAVTAEFVAVPVLATEAVIDQLLLGGTYLSEAEIFYLDFHGNQNGIVDVGDVLAWIDRNEDPSEAAAAAAALFEAVGKALEERDREDGADAPRSTQRSRRTSTPDEAHR
jgi:M6 family metalloprotease-like protein